MKKISTILFTSLLALSLVGCNSDNSETKKTDKLTNTSWVAISATSDKNVMEKDLITSTIGETTLNFKEDNVVTIKLGNKSGSGKYTLEGENITIKSSKDIKASYKDESITMTVDGVIFTFDKNIAKDEAKYSKTITAGTYTVGTDLPTGKYNLNVKSGAGSYMLSINGSEPTAKSIASEESDTDVKEIKNINLAYGNKVIIMGNAEIELFSEDADEKTLTKRENPLTKEINLEPGTYTAGVDFEEGVYDITSTGDEGQVITDGKTVGGVNDIMSKEGSNSSVKTVKNVELTDNQTITITTTKVTLTPSK
ncbi:MAG: hypothetical protein SOY42_10980 [Clostridium sp.]|nr:hypothetical protein [Clostridium sp.]